MTKDAQTEIDIVGMKSIHPALLSRIVRQALMRAAPGRFVGFDHVEQVLELAEAPEGMAIDVPGQRAIRGSD